VARLSAATAAEIGAVAGRRVTITASRGSITLPVEVTAMPDRVVWVPTHSPGSHVRRALAGDAGVLVRVGPAEDDPPAEDGTPAGDDTPGGRA
jgi:NADH-quinone oxidoreductase subunit G